MQEVALAYQAFLRISPEESLFKLGTTSTGLSAKEAVARLSSVGPNTLRSQSVTWNQILARQFKSPFIFLLLAAAALALILGEYIDSVMILMFVFINASLGFFQEFHSEQAIKVLKQYTAAHATVIRDGMTQLVAVSEVVPGDCIQLQPGDIVPADLRLIQTTNLHINESVLTGESKPTIKSSSARNIEGTAIHQAATVAFSGTSVANGSGIGVVVATGANAYIGTIAQLTTETHQVSSFEKGMSSFSTFVLRLVALTLVIVFVANTAIRGSATNFGDLLIFSIALATAVIPEALPLVITFSLSRGAVRLSQHKVIVKRLSAIEDLGGIQVLCTDKTGTITQNALTVVETFGDETTVLSLANRAISQHAHHKDPFDVALEKSLPSQIHLPQTSVLHELPFDPERRRNSVLTADKGAGLLIVRGAAPALISNADSHRHMKLLEWIKIQENQGRRVMVVGSRRMAARGMYTKTAEEHHLTIAGAIAFSDPLKKSAYQAVQKAQKLGVAIKIVTGDSPIVAGCVAHEIKLVQSPQDVVTSADFFALPLTKQRQVARTASVFARFSPHEKHQLIAILQHEFEVGFLGEGINDAPALKTANVALVVHGASDIAREAADVILLNPSLRVIIDGIQEGREVFANTIKYVKITLASNFGNFYAVAIASLFIDFLPMLPIQILLVNLLSDFPLVAIATDTVDAEEVREPESYNLKDFALIATLLGMVSTVFDFVYFGLFYRISPAVLQTNWFIASILTELALLYSLRTRFAFFRAHRPPLLVALLTSAAAIATVVIPFTKIGQEVFKFTPPSQAHLLLIFAIVGCYFVCTEVAKLLYYRFIGSGARKELASHSL